MRQVGTSGGNLAQPGGRGRRGWRCGCYLRDVARCVAPPVGRARALGGRWLRCARVGYGRVGAMGLRRLWGIVGRCVASGGARSRVSARRPPGCDDAKARLREAQHHPKFLYWTRCVNGDQAATLMAVRLQILQGIVKRLLCSIIGQKWAQQREELATLQPYSHMGWRYFARTMRNNFPRFCTRSHTHTQKPPFTFRFAFPGL